MRRVLDILEDMVSHPYQPPEPEPATGRTPMQPVLRAVEPQPSAPLLVSIKEARRLVGVSHSRIYELINDGTLETIRLGKRRLIRYSSLQNLAGG